MANTRGTRRRFGALRRLPSGRWQARYTGPDLGTHKAPRTFESQDDATGWLRAEELSIERDEWTPPAERAAKAEKAAAVKVETVGSYGSRWLAERDLRPTTRRTYSEVWEGRILGYLGDVPLAELDAPRVRQWWAEITAAHDTPTRNRHAHALLRSMAATAMDDGLISGNPVDVKAARKVPHRRDVDLLTVPELVAVTEKMPKHYAASVPLAAWCALRVGELLELRRRDIAADGSSVHVRRAVSWVGDGVVVGAPKTAAGIRKVAVPPHLRSILVEHLATYTEKGGDSLVFRNAAGERLRGTTFRAALRDAVKAAGVDKHVTPHHLRHLGATMAAMTGASVRDLMGRLGHSSAAMSLRYQHAVEGRDAAVADALSKLAE